MNINTIGELKLPDFKVAQQLKDLGRFTLADKLNQHPIFPCIECRPLDHFTRSMYYRLLGLFDLMNSTSNRHFNEEIERMIIPVNAVFDFDVQWPVKTIEYPGWTWSSPRKVCCRRNEILDIALSLVPRDSFIEVCNYVRMLHPEVNPCSIWCVSWIEIGLSTETHDH